MKKINKKHEFFIAPEGDDVAFLESGAEQDIGTGAGSFNPVLWLVILFVVGFICLEIIQFFLPEAVVRQWFQGHTTLLFVIISAFLAVFIMTLFGFFRLQGARRQVAREYDLMKSVLEGSKGARFICDPDGRGLYANVKFYEIIGLLDEKEQNEFTLQDLERFFSNSLTQTQISLQDMASAARDGDSQMSEIPTVDDDGVEKYYAIAIHAVGGWKNYTHVRIDDVTDKHDIEKVTDFERKRLLDFMDNALVGFFSVDEKGHFLFANSTLAKWLGVKETDFDGMTLHDCLVEPPIGGAPYDVVEGGGTKQFGEMYVKTADGETFLVAIAHAVIHENGEAVRTQSVVRDLTPEYEMKEALKRSEDRFHRFFDDAPTGILLINQDGKIEEVNKSFCVMTGQKSSVLIGAFLVDCLNKESQPALKTLIRAIDLQEDANKEAIEVHLLPDYGDITIQLTANKLRGSKSFIIHVSDLSKQKQLEVQFTQSQKMQAVGQLAGGVAHDFNNLLTAMIGFCDLLLERHQAGDPSFQDIMQIQQNANRAANLVRQLLAFSRQQTLRPQLLDMTDVLSELSNLLRRLIGVNITLTMHHGRDLWPIKADQGQMDQVFINLVVNARDAMVEKFEKTAGGKNKKQDGDITITSEAFQSHKEIELVSDVLPQGEWVKIDVRDQGCGIPEDIITRIFDPFFTTKSLGEGTGLGLSTVYGIIRQTGGYLDVQSVVDKGTVFTIFLPRASADDLEKLKVIEKEPTKTKDLTGSERILLVEDEEAVRKFSKRALSAKGYEVLEAEHGAAAVKVYDENDGAVDLVITDVMMPEMDGPTMAKILQEKKPGIKILFVSGFSEDRISDYAGENIYFLAKPFSLKQLAGKVKEILEESQ